jgi:F0F1-type ATP synthase assembly protein I
MKKTNSFQLGETLKVVLMAVGFLAFIMLVSYLYWFA